MNLPQTQSATLAAACREYLTAYDGARTSAAFSMSPNAQREAADRLSTATHYLAVLVRRLGMAHAA